MPDIEQLRKDAEAAWRTAYGIASQFGAVAPCVYECQIAVANARDAQSRYEAAKRAQEEKP